MFGNPQNSKVSSKIFCQIWLWPATLNDTRCHINGIGINVIFSDKKNQKKKPKEIVNSFQHLRIEDRKGTVAKLKKKKKILKQNYELECSLKYSKCFLFGNTILTNWTKYKNL
jgi:hypothetical protein